MWGRGSWARLAAMALLLGLWLLPTRPKSSRPSWGTSASSMTRSIRPSEAEPLFNRALFRQPGNGRCCSSSLPCKSASLSLRARPEFS
jgi:hypothetical protein